MEYIGVVVSIILSVGLIICFLSALGYNVILRCTKEKIEVQTQNSNFKSK